MACTSNVTTDSIASSTTSAARTHLAGAEYVSEATQRGQETAARIQGRSILQIYFFDTDSAAESGIAAYNGPDPLSDPAAYSVVEVHLTPNYERGTQSFVGLRTDYPQFQVTTLIEPTRIAVDIHD
ncbi:MULTISPECIES: AMIN-like domain-containing (lipo)protein [Rhodococcus]|uniref:AMIN-like domain-containing (lipo)protein n=1 Tax=Rhodococcus TaxID=1827 RepID=UPI000A98B48E|nr:MULTISPECIES: hypothetical protein [Rhodococcus]